MACCHAESGLRRNIPQPCHIYFRLTDVNELMRPVLCTRAVVAFAPRNAMPVPLLNVRKMMSKMMYLPGSETICLALARSHGKRMPRIISGS